MAAVIGLAVSAVGGIASAAGGSDPAGQTTSTQQSGAPSWLQPYLGGAVNDAFSLYQKGGPQYYPGSTYVPMNGGQSYALSRLEDKVNSTPQADAASGFVGGLEQGYYQDNPANQYFERYANGQMLDAGNPYFSAMADSVRTNTQPGLMNSFNSGNRMNSPGAAFAVSNGVASALAPYAYKNYEDAQNRQLAAAGQIGQNYNTGIGQRLQGAALMPALQQMDINNIMAAYNASSMRQADAQRGVSDDVARWNYNQSLPSRNLSQYASMLTGLGGLAGGQSSYSQPYYQDPGMGIMSAGLGMLGTQGAQDTMKGWFA